MATKRMRAKDMVRKIFHSRANMMVMAGAGKKVLSGMVRSAAGMRATA